MDKLEEYRYLYRGISEEFFKKGIGLIPKGNLRQSPTFYGVAKYDSGETYGESINNTVILHQRNSTQFPSAFISTTPHYKRAKYYALMGNKAQRGYIYKIDRSLFKQHTVEQFIVKEFANYPEIPEDDEVLLVTKDNDKLPSEVILEVIPVSICTDKTSDAAP